MNEKEILKELENNIPEYRKVESALGLDLEIPVYEEKMKKSEEALVEKKGLIERLKSSRIAKAFENIVGKVKSMFSKKENMNV